MLPKNDKFARTKAALKTFDTFTENVWEPSTWRNFEANDAERNRLARAVGRAFGEDTVEVNSPDTCEGCVRPGDVRAFLVHESWKGVHA
jgi:hypothetical protein